MAEKRIVGIDFGTSTSVVRVKLYNVINVNGVEVWKSAGSADHSLSVVFDGGSVMTPTLVKKLNDSFGTVVFGQEAETAYSKNQEMFSNFKIELEGENKESAKKLTEEFFKYLYDEYNQQRNGGHFGNAVSEEITVISYPVKWSEETRSFMLEAAKKAGFSNVQGMDEAQAAIYAATTLSNSNFSSDFLHGDVPINIMLIDMGAGTTDIVICRYNRGKAPEVLCTWPEKGGVLFGGREIDECLRDYILQYVPEEYKEIISKKISINEYKVWKESNVSKSLHNIDGSVTTCMVVDKFLSNFDVELGEFNLDRKEFENFLGNTIVKFSELVNGSIKNCVDSGNLSGGGDIDLVILTGGHSQWYFVQTLLLGESIGGSESISLNKIKENPKRIISLTRPQEMVALGLVYSKLPLPVPKIIPRREETKIIPPNETDKRKNEDNEYHETPLEDDDRTHKISADITERFKNADIKIKNRLVNESAIPIAEEPSSVFKRSIDNNSLQDILKDFFIHNATNIGSRISNRALLSKLGITDSIVYFCHDSTILGSGRSGTAATADGIYMREFLTREFIPWEQFATRPFDESTGRSGNQQISMVGRVSALFNLLNLRLASTDAFRKTLELYDVAYMNHIALSESLEKDFEKAFGKFDGSFLPYHLGVPEEANNHIFYYNKTVKKEICVCDHGIYIGVHNDASGGFSIQCRNYGFNVDFSKIPNLKDEPAIKVITENLLYKKMIWVTLEDASIMYLNAYSKGREAFLKAFKAQKAGEV